MLRVATTHQERREAERYWQRMRERAAHIRDAYERGEARRQRANVGGTSTYVDASILFLGYTGK